MVKERPNSQRKAEGSEENTLRRVDQESGPGGGEKTVIELGRKTPTIRKTQLLKRASKTRKRTRLKQKKTVPGEGKGGTREKETAPKTFKGVPDNLRTNSRGTR